MYRTSLKYSGHFSQAFPYSNAEFFYQNTVSLDRSFKMFLDPAFVVEKQCIMVVVEKSLKGDDRSQILLQDELGETLLFSDGYELETLP